MGCNCNNDISKEAVEKRIKLKELNQSIKKINKMAKSYYKVLDSVSQDARLTYNKQRMTVRDISQGVLKLLYETGHPQVEKVEGKIGSTKKED